MIKVQYVKKSLVREANPMKVSVCRGTKFYVFSYVTLALFTLLTILWLNLSSSPFARTIAYNLGSDKSGKSDSKTNTSAHNETETKNILYWNELVFYPDWNFGIGTEPFHANECAERRCRVYKRTGEGGGVSDLELVARAHAVLFNAPSMTKDTGYPGIRLPWQRWVFAAREPPTIYDMDYPWFRQGSFNWTMTYLRGESDIYWGYGAVSAYGKNNRVVRDRKPAYDSTGKGGVRTFPHLTRLYREHLKNTMPNNQGGGSTKKVEFLRMAHEMGRPKEDNKSNNSLIYQSEPLNFLELRNMGIPKFFLNSHAEYTKRNKTKGRDDRAMPAGRKFAKPKIAVWFVSNCGTLGGREHYYRELARHVDIDVYGTCGPDPDLTCGSNGNQPSDAVNYSMSRDLARREVCYAMMAREYAFYLAFENSLCRDYVSEKFFEPLSRDIIPVVYGDADYGTYAPPGTFLDARSFATPRDLARYMLALYTDPTAYDAILSAKRWLLAEGRLIVAPAHPYATARAMCDLCAKLHEADDGRVEHKTYPDVQEWWYKGRCKKYCLPWGLCTRTDYELYTRPSITYV